MNRKSSLWLILFLAFSLILCACTKQPQEDGTSSSTSAEQDIYAQAQTVTELGAVKYTVAPTISALSGGKFVTAYTQEQKTDSKDNGAGYTTCLDVFDAKSHEVKAHTELEGDFRLIERTFSNGNIAAINNYDDTICIFDSSLNKIHEIAAKNLYNATLSYDCDKLYYTDSGNLLCMDLSTKESVVLISAGKLVVNSIESAHPNKPWLNMYAYTDPCSQAPSYITVDMESGELIAMQSDISSRKYCDDSEYAQYFDSEKMQSYIVYKTAAQSSYSAFSSTLDGKHELDMLTGYPYMLRTAFAADTAEDSMLYKLGSEISSANLTSAGIAGNVCEARYMPEANLMVCSSFDKAAQQGRLYIVDMRTLSFESISTPETIELPSMVTDELNERYKELVAPTTLPKSLDEMRAYADELEGKFGVHILISSECAEGVENAEISTTTTDKENLNNELLVIKGGLDTLNQVFLLYPNGFFKQFQAQNGEGGIYVYLAGSMSAAYPVEAYASYDGTGCYKLVMNICGVTSLKKNFYHELWHTTESRILAKDSGAFSGDKWNKLNPPEFVYTQAYAGAVEDANTWIYKNDDDVYFVDDYSKRYPHEDRARIMEYIMANNADTEELLKSEAIRKKLKFMCDAIRQTFDTTLWDSVPWERAD